MLDLMKKANLSGGGRGIPSDSDSEDISDMARKKRKFNVCIAM